MSREVKFRFLIEDEVWTEEEIQNDGDMYIEYMYGKGPVVMCYVEDGYAGRNEEISILREQYTGLTDKNGVEIYEGDIVAIQYDFDEPTIHEVVWGGIDYPAFEFSPDLGCECNGFAQYYNDPDTNVEVIGNIHQNHELLN